MPISTLSLPRKKCDCIRSDMTSGAETIGSVDKILYFDFYVFDLFFI